MPSTKKRVCRKCHKRGAHFAEGEMICLECHPPSRLKNPETMESASARRADEVIHCLIHASWYKPVYRKPLVAGGTQPRKVITL